MRILVTGHKGFIGKYVYSHLKYDAGYGQLVEGLDFPNVTLVGIVNAEGAVAAHTGGNTRSWAGHVTGDGFIVMGNVLAGEEVLQTMSDTFNNQEKADLDERLLCTLEAGRDAGGQATADGTQLNERSAAVIIHDNRDYAHIDLRVDVHEAAVNELRHVHSIYKPFIPYYEMRHHHPQDTPAQDLWARDNL